MRERGPSPHYQFMDTFICGDDVLDLVGIFDGRDLGDRQYLRILLSVGILAKSLFGDGFMQYSDQTDDVLRQIGGHLVIGVSVHTFTRYFFLYNTL